MKKILIVESPAKIKTISKFLDKDFQIMSTVGHIKDLPPKELGVTVDDTVHIAYSVIAGKEKVIADICKASRTADVIYLAPDPDREGEIIAWLIGQDIEKVAKKGAIIHRITFNEITQNAIQNAIDHPGSIDMQKVAAQQARRVLDRWVGYEVSPVLWKKIAPGLSAGRVQSVALRLICDRENEIRVFKVEEYWSIDATFAHNKDTITAALTHIGKKKAEIKTEQEAKDTAKEIKKDSFIIESITDKTRKKNPHAPFMTSTLQQASYNRLGFSVKKTMQVAQHLYEGIPLDDPSTPVALITYMRTDSLRLSDTALTQARDFINKNYGKDYLPTKSNVFERAGKTKAQEAHEAIRPINVAITPEMVRRHLKPDEAKLYGLIWQRFVASQMKPAEYAQRQVVIKGEKFTFKITGSTLIFDGFLKVYGEDEDEKEAKVTVPASLKEKNPLSVEKVDPTQHFTQPPPRYTEASLVKEMEKEGIGRPSTYATIMNTIRERSYTTLDQRKRFVPTELGMTVTDLLVKNLPNIMDIKFTALMESDLDKIAHGDLDRDELLIGFHKTFSADLNKFIGEDGKKRIATPTDITCPECGKHKLAIRFGKGGEFLGCMGYPDCPFTTNFKRDEHGVIELVAAEKPKVLDELCPKCGKPLRELIGKYGPFIACSGYPECKYIKQNTANFPCPQCGGSIIERAWRGGKFWGCSNYPKCKFAIFDQIEQTPCPQCKAPFLVKKFNKDGTVTLRCHDKNCGYTNS